MQTRLIVGLSIGMSYLSVAYFMLTGNFSVVMNDFRSLGYDPQFIIYIFLVSALANIYIGIRGFSFNILWHLPLVILTLMTAHTAYSGKISWYPVALYVLILVRLGIDCYQDYKYGTDRQYD